MERFQYREAGPQLLLQAFLQRIVNGGGRIEREYGLGRMRTDLLLVWPVGSGAGGPARAGEGRETHKVVIERKVLRRSLDRTRLPSASLEDRVAALAEGARPLVEVVGVAEVAERV